jgi:hypothetical protein
MTTAATFRRPATVLGAILAALTLTGPAWGQTVPEVVGSTLEATTKAAEPVTDTVTQATAPVVATATSTVTDTARAVTAPADTTVTPHLQDAAEPVKRTREPARRAAASTQAPHPTEGTPASTSIPTAVTDNVGLPQPAAQPRGSVPAPTLDRSILPAAPFSASGAGAGFAPALAVLTAFLAFALAASIGRLVPWSDAVRPLAYASPPERPG